MVEKNRATTDSIKKRIENNINGKSMPKKGGGSNGQRGKVGRRRLDREFFLINVFFMNCKRNKTVTI